MRYRIRIEKQKLNFAAAHFITLENECEALHGHNYYTLVEIEGKPDDNHFILDFKVLKREMQELCDGLDHKVLMPTKNPNLTVREAGGQFEVLYRDKRYSFPVEDVIALPIPNTTVEMLSEYLCRRLKEVLGKKGYLTHAAFIEVGVEESAGQMALFRIDL